MAKRIPPEPKSEDESEETLAAAIRAISKATKRLAKSGLNRRAIIALVHDHSRISKRTISDILDTLDELAETYAD